MENKVVHKGKVIWFKTNAVSGLYLDMPRKTTEEAHLSFPLSGAFGTIAVEEIFKPYLNKDISITFEKKDEKINKITIQEELK
jgi:hypothetical protein